MLLLDTTVLVDFLRSSPRVSARLHERGGPFVASVISVDEIAFGMQPDEEERVDLLIDGLELLPVGVAEARLSGMWRRRHRAAGQTLKPPDTLIAATAAIAGLPLATANINDFPMPELHVEHWPSE